MKFQLKLVSVCLYRKKENLSSPLYGHKIQKIFHLCQRNKDIFSNNILGKNNSDREENGGASKEGREVVTELQEPLLELGSRPSHQTEFLELKNMHLSI